MGDTVGRVDVKVDVDSRGVERGIRDAVDRAGDAAEKRGRDAGETFGEEFVRSAEERMGKGDFKGAFEGLDEEMRRASDIKFAPQLDELHRMGEEFKENERIARSLAQQDRNLAEATRKINENLRPGDLKRFSDEMRALREETERTQRANRRPIFEGLRNQVRNFADEYRRADDEIRRRPLLGGMDNEFRRTAVSFGGFLGHFQSFGRLLRTGSVDIRNWRAGLIAVTDTAIGFGKSLYKAALALGPLAGGLSSIAGIATAFAGSLQTGIIGGLAAIGPLAIAAGAAMFTLSIGMQAFGKHATDAQQKAVKPLTDQFTKFKAAISGAVLGNVTEQSKLLTPVLGQLQRALVGVGGAVSGTITNLLKVVGPGGQAGDSFKRLTDALAPLTTQLGQAVTNTISGFVGMLAAAVPVSTRFANALIGLTSRFANFANSTKGQSTLADIFNRGYDAAAKIMTILGRLGVALFKVFNIGDQAGGEKFLDTLLAKVTQFNNYVSSARGVQELKGWFADARYAATSLGTAIGALAKAFGALDVGQTRDQFREMVDFAARLVTGFAGLVGRVQALTSPFSTLGSAASQAWDQIKQLARTVADMFSQVETSGAGVLASGLNLLGGAAGIANAALGALQPVLSLILAAFNALPGPIQSVVTSLLLMKRIGAFTAIEAGVSRLGIAMAGLSTTAAGTSRSMGTGILAAARGGIGKVGLLARGAAAAFGPVGIAIGVASIGLALWSNHQKKAAAAAALHRKEVDGLVKSMQASSAITGAAVTATTAKELADRGALTTAKQLGIATKDVVAATTADGKARQNIATVSVAANNKLIAMRQALTLNNGVMKDGTRVTGDMVNKQQDLVNKYASVGSAMRGVNKSLTDAQSKWLQTAQAQAALSEATGAVNPLIQDLTKQMQTFADSTQSATTRTNAFASALNELTDKSMSTQQAAIKQADSMRSLDQAFGATKNSAGQVISQGENLRKAFIGNTSSLDTSSKAASDLVQNFQSNVVPAFSDVVRAAFDAAGGVKNLGPATIAASKAAASYDAQLRGKLINSFHLTGAQADSLIKQFHLMPTDVTTLSKLIGGKATEAQLQSILDKAKDVGLTPVQLRANAEQAVKTSADLQAKIDRIHQGKVPGIAANSAQGRAVVSDLQAKINAIRQATATRLAANPAAAKATIADLQRRLNAILQKNPTALRANSSPAHATAVALQGEINAMRATMLISADMSPAERIAAGWQPPAKQMKIYAAGGDVKQRYGMAGAIVNKPQMWNVGELGKREAIIPLDLPLGRVSPEVRGMAALLRGQGTTTNNVNAAPTKINHNTINVYPQAADPAAVSVSVLNKLTVLGR